MVYNKSYKTNQLKKYGVLFIKKIITLICAAIILLTGCESGTTDIPSFTFPGNSSEKSTSSSDGVHGSETVSSDSSSSSETTSESEPLPAETSEPSVDTSEPTAETSESPAAETQTLILNNDPRNEKSLTVSGTTAVIRGRASDSRLDYAWTTADAEVDTQKDGDEFTVEVTLNKNTGGTEMIILVYENHYSDDITLKLDQNGFALCDLSDIVQKSASVVENAFDQPLNQVAEYIVEGGSPAEMHKVMDEIRGLSDEICSGFDNDYDKLRAISRWVSENIYYDYPSYDRGIPAETLSLKYMLDNHSSVCGGYSNMTSALCAVQGIKCWNVHGSSVSGSETFADGADGEYHEWNYALIDGRIVWVDSGWNSQCYLRRGGIYDFGEIGYKYFDIGEEYFAQDHKPAYAEYRDYLSLVQ